MTDNVITNKITKCNTCTRRLLLIAYQGSPWLRIVREPLKFIMVSWVRISRINIREYEVHSPGCYKCMRFYKTALKEHSALFRLLNAMANPVFDTILEQIVSKEDIDKAKAHARAAMLDEPLPYDGDQYLSDSRWWEI